jgi:hypothetical protein
MTEQPVNLSTAIYLGVFSRAEQRVLQAIFKAMAEGCGECVATLAMLARDSNTSKSTTRNAITQAVEIGLLEKTERLPTTSGASVALRMSEPAPVCRAARSPDHEARFEADERIKQVGPGWWTYRRISSLAMRYGPLLGGGYSTKYGKVNVESFGPSGMISVETESTTSSPRSTISS